jgi:hypothetical protein
MLWMLRKPGQRLRTGKIPVLGVVCFQKTNLKRECSQRLRTKRSVTGERFLLYGRRKSTMPAMYSPSLGRFRSMDLLA